MHRSATIGSEVRRRFNNNSSQSCMWMCHEYSSESMHSAERTQPNTRRPSPCAWRSMCWLWLLAFGQHFSQHNFFYVLFNVLNLFFLLYLIHFLFCLPVLCIKFEKLQCQKLCAGDGEFLQRWLLQTRCEA